MQLGKILLLTFVLLFSSLLKTPSYSQIIKTDSILASAWVDSVFNSMNITERIEQLFLVEIDANSIINQGLLGGVIVNESDLNAHISALNNLPTSVIRPLIFHGLNDNPFGLNIDSVDHFGSDVTIGMLTEPHLFYEIGSSIGKQCLQLGISGVFSTNSMIMRLQGYSEWGLSELNQGLIDQNILPIDALKIHDFQSDTASFMRDLNSWNLLKVSSDNFHQIHQIFKEAVLAEKIEVTELDEKCKSILAMKRWVWGDNSTERQIIATNKLLDVPGNLLLQEEMAKYALVVTGISKNSIPIKQIKHKKIAQLSIGNDYKSDFNEYANMYTPVDYYETDYTSRDEVYAGIWTKLNSYDLIICSYHNLDQLPDEESEYEGFLIFQEWIVKSGKHISVIFLNDSTKGITNIINDAKVEIIVLEDNQFTNKLVPQLIFGGIDANGKLAIRKGDVLIGSVGVEINNINRFSYTLPEAAGLSSPKLRKIDSIAVVAIQAKAMPGCQILVAKDNKVVYQKSFGFHTYDSVRSVSNTDLYDLASITKVSGAIPALMKLYEEGKFNLDATMGTYLPYFKKGNKKSLTYREILAHQSGLTPYIVYWQSAIRKNGKYKRKTLSTKKSEDFNYELSPGLYLHNDYKKKIYRQIRKSKLGEKKYSYSGLTFLLYPDIIESITGQDYESYLRGNFYEPLGASTLTYTPLKNFETEHIIPTEYDSLFRKAQIHGKVHDEAAAMMEGVSSNAGLFANANDLAKLFQMYCNYGTYGNKEYLNEESLLEFSRCQYPENDNRRGLGFDRPLSEPHENGNTAKSVSQLSFGHSGFTGTFAWVDPEYNLVYIFLSNRVYKTRSNTKLYNMNVRTNIQEVIYEAMETD